MGITVKKYGLNNIKVFSYLEHEFHDVISGHPAPDCSLLKFCRVFRFRDVLLLRQIDTASDADCSVGPLIYQIQFLGRCA